LTRSLFSIKKEILFIKNKDILLISGKAYLLINQMMKEARALPKALRMLIDQMMMTTSKVRKERDRKKVMRRLRIPAVKAKLATALALSTFEILPNLLILILIYNH
jgi:hypothetical protein